MKSMGSQLLCTVLHRYLAFFFTYTLPNSVSFSDSFLCREWGGFQLFSLPSLRSKNHPSVLTFSWGLFVVVVWADAGSGELGFQPYRVCCSVQEGLVLSTFLPHVPSDWREPQWPLTGIFWASTLCLREGNITKLWPVLLFAMAV